MLLSSGAQVFTLVGLERVCSYLSMVTPSCLASQREFYVPCIDCMLSDQSKYTFQIWQTFLCVLITNGTKHNLKKNCFFPSSFLSGATTNYIHTQGDYT